MKNGRLQSGNGILAKSFYCTHRINGTGTGIFTYILHEWLILMVNVGKHTIAPENGWLEDDPVFLLGPNGLFSGVPTRFCPRKPIS